MNVRGDHATSSSIGAGHYIKSVTLPLASRLRGTGLFPIKDVDRLTVFADYELPKTLHHLGILDYSPELDRKIREGARIEAGSREELELRAHTIYAAKIARAGPTQSGRQVGPLGVDYALWSLGVNLKHVSHYLTDTTAY